MRISPARFSGSLLVETLVATTIVVFLVVLVYISFREVTEWGVRNRQAGVGLTLLGTLADIDARRNYDDEALIPGTRAFIATDAGYENFSALDNARVTHVITELQGIKRIQYILEWTLNNNLQRVTAEQEITTNGVTND